MASSDIREILRAVPSLHLPSGVFVLDVAESCRRATVQFLESSDDKRALATWLLGPYRELTSFGVTPSRQERIIGAPVRAEQVSELAAYARAYVHGIIRGIARVDGDLTFSVAAVHGGWIEACVDESGRLGWVPVDRPKMRLTERVLSLLAVDYLERPADWLGSRVKIAG